MTTDSTLRCILDVREGSYGKFGNNATLAQMLKGGLRMGVNWNGMSADKKEAMDQIVSKLSRLVTGDSEHEDSWRDIMGYAKLVLDELSDV